MLEADADGFYDVQYRDDRVAARAHMFTDAEGRYRFWELTPTRTRLRMRGPWASCSMRSDALMRPGHLHFMFTAQDLRTVVTHVFIACDPQLEVGDAVFGVKNSLIKEFTRQGSGTPTPDGGNLGGREWSRGRFDIILAPATVGP